MHTTLPQHLEGSPIQGKFNNDFIFPVGKVNNVFRDVKSMRVGDSVNTPRTKEIPFLIEYPNRRRFSLKHIHLIS
tara:strand:- start:347 stop:571 length:225 start_codon:yes stop_codon:yes gene_type:complete